MASPNYADSAKLCCGTCYFSKLTADDKPDDLYCDNLNSQEYMDNVHPEYRCDEYIS